MPDYGDSKGFGGSGGGEAATGGMGKGQGSGYGGGNGMSQATRDRLADMAKTDITNTEAEVAKSRLAEERERQMFSQKMKEQADKASDINYTDTLALYDALKTQNINPNQVNLKNYTTGPFAQKNVVMLGNKRIGQFGQVPTFGISGLLASLPGFLGFDLDTKNLMLDKSTFGDPFDDRGGNRPPDDIMEILYPGSPDAPGEGEDRGEGKAYIDDPAPTGYDLAFKDFYGQQLEDGGRVGFEKGGTELFERTKKIPEMLTTDELPSDPLSQIIKIGMTVRAPLMDVVEALGLGVKETTRMIADLTRKGFDVTKPARDAISGAVTSTGEFLKEDVGDMGRFVSMPYYLQRFGGQKNLSDTETRLVRELDSTVGRSTPERTKMLKEKLFKEIYGSGPVDKSSIQLAPGMVSGKSKTIGLANGGLASLPMNFNPMTNANPFSMMMRGGR